MIDSMSLNNYQQNQFNYDVIQCQNNNEDVS